MLPGLQLCSQKAPNSPTVFAGHTLPPGAVLLRRKDENGSFLAFSESFLAASEKPKRLSFIGFTTQPRLAHYAPQTVDKKSEVFWLPAGEPFSDS